MENSGMHLSVAELGLVAKSEPSMQTRWTRSDIEAKLRELTTRLDGLDGFKQAKAIVTENVGLFPSSRSKNKISSIQILSFFTRTRKNHTHKKSKINHPLLGYLIQTRKLNKGMKIWRSTLPEHLAKDQDLVKA
ncbi:hypothetical protein M0R45_014271 [Rubus argutus]|uniref:Uncharacterized protein n=1 Tax=Rubus argutus TaxID=59490 RepID=A0AAW1XNM5_RUBAR